MKTAENLTVKEKRSRQRRRLGKIGRVPIDTETCEELRVERIFRTSHRQGGPIIKNRRPRRNGEPKKPVPASTKKKTGKRNVVARIYRKIEIKAATASDSATKPTGQNLLTSDPTARPRTVRKITESAE